MKRILSLAALFLAVGSSAFAAGNLEPGPNPDLKYDPSTGVVTLVPSPNKGGGKIIGFVLISNDGLFKPQADDAFRNATPWEEGELTDEEGNPLVPPKFVMDNGNKQIGSADLSFKGGKTDIVLGSIFPTGLNLQTLNSLLSKAEVSWNTGATGKGNLDLIVVPEPSSVALLGLGLVAVNGLVRRRRK